MNFEFDHFRIRRWKQGDEISLAKYANNKNIWRNVRDSFPYPYTLRNAKEWIGIANLVKVQSNFAIEIENNAVGGIGIALKEDIYRHTGEIGYWLGEEFWNRGIMTVAVRTITEFAFTEFDICRIYGEIFEGNISSARVLEKAGYECEGRFKRSVTKEGKTMDSFIYAKVK